MRRFAVLVGLLVSTSVHAQQKPSPLSDEAKQAVAGLKVAEGFRVDLMASEPLIGWPTKLAWAHDGSLWIAEAPTGKRTGLVKRLLRSDKKGHYDSAEVMATGLDVDTQLMPWSDGMFVASEGRILHVTKKDGRVREELWFHGFGTPFQSSVWGNDGWIYGGAHCESPEIVAEKWEKRFVVPKHLRRRPLAFRFSPLKAEIEFCDGFYPPEFRDDLGHWFSLNQYHPKLDQAFRSAASYNWMTDNAKQTYRLIDPVESNLVKLPKRKMNPYWTTLFTGAWSKHRQPNLYIASATEHAIFRRPLFKVDDAFKLARDYGNAEFIAAPKNVPFVPVHLATGPDGALWIVDFGPNPGPEKGRILRIVPEDFPAAEETSILLAEATKHLQGRNSTIRDAAQRVLLASPKPQQANELIELARSHKDPGVRLASLAILGLSHDYISPLIRGLEDPESAVRHLALRLLEPWGSWGYEQYAHLPLPAQPRRELPIVLPAENVLPKLARVAGEDFPVLRRVRDLEMEGPRPMVRDLASFISGGYAEEVVWRKKSLRTVDLESAAKEQPRGCVLLLAPLFRELRDSKQSLPQWWESIRRPASVYANEPNTKPLAETLAHAIAEAAIMVEKGSPYEVEAGLALLGIGETTARQLHLIVARLDAREPLSVTTEALHALRRGKEPAGLIIAIRNAKRYTPAVRAAVFEMCFAVPSMERVLLDHLKAGELAPGELERRFRPQVAFSLPEEVARFRESIRRPDREQVVSRFWLSQFQPRDAGNGELLFRQHCARCHASDAERPSLRRAPSISTWSHLSADDLIAAIFDPHREMDPQYLLYAIEQELPDGGSVKFEAAIVQEKVSDLIVRRYDGSQQTVPRREIRKIESLGRSLMPANFETQLSEREVADLIQYVRNRTRLKP